MWFRFHYPYPARTFHPPDDPARGSQQKGQDMKNIFDILGDVCGVIAIFGGGYALLVIGHGVGW